MWIQKPNDVWSKKGSTIEVTCSATGHPSPSITWRRHRGTCFPSKSSSRLTPLTPNCRSFRRCFAHHGLSYEGAECPRVRCRLLLLPSSQRHRTGPDPPFLHHRQRYSNLHIDSQALVLPASGPPGLVSQNEALLVHKGCTI